MREQLQGLARALALGYVLYFWSERAFWSFWRAQDGVGPALFTWLVYCLLGAMLSAVLRTYRVSTFAPVFLAGAVYGWLAEGVVVDTMYGSAGNPFPLSVSFTGLAWHALLSVCLGWWWLARSLASHERWMVARRAAALGAGWGLWAVWWQNEADRAFSTSVAAFAAHTVTFSAPLVVAFWTLGMLRPPEEPPSRRERGFLLALSWTFFLLVRVPATPKAALVLPPLLLLCWLGLRRSARGALSADAPSQTAGRYGARECLPLIVLPVAAVATYSALSWTRLPTNVGLYVVTMPCGFWLFGRSLWTTLRPRRRSHADPAGVNADQAAS